MSQNENGWQKVRFDQMVQHRSHRIEPGETELEKYVGLKHIRPGSLRFNEYGDPSDVKGIKLEVWPDDVIFAKRGFNLLRKLAVADFHGICSAHSMVLRAKEETLLNDLLPFFILSDKFFDTACAISVGSLSKTINWKDLAKQEFVIPPIEKQKEIAELLWETENIGLRYLTLSKHIFSLFSSLRRRLYTEESETMSMSDVVHSIIAGKSLNATNKTPKENQFAVLKVGSVGKRRFEPEESKILNDQTAFLPQFSVKKEDLLISRANTIELVGQACLVDKNYSNLMLSDKTLKLDVDESKISKRILLEVLRSSRIKIHLRKRGTGTGGQMKNISQRDIKDMKVPRLSSTVQDKYNVIFQYLDKIENKINRKMDEHRNFRRRMIKTLLDPGTANA